MVTYLQLVKDLVSPFESFKVTHIPRVANSKVDRLAQIGYGIDHDLTCPVEVLQSSSISELSINSVNKGETWMTPIIKYLENGELPLDKVEAYVLRTKAAHYVYKFRQLYKQGYSNPLLKYVTLKRGLYVM